MKNIKVNWVVTFKHKGFFRYCCYLKKRETLEWLKLRWVRNKKRTLALDRPFVRRRPRHTLCKLIFLRDGEPQASVYTDSLNMAVRLGKLWQRTTKRRAYSIIDYRFHRRVVLSKLPVK